MPNYNLSKIKIFLSYEDDIEEVFNLRIDESTTYSKRCSELPSEILDKLTSNGLDFNFRLNPDFLYGLISYFEFGGRLVLDNTFEYKGLSRTNGRSNFTFEPKSQIVIPYLFQRCLQNEYTNNSNKFFLWADKVLFLLSFCEDSRNSLVNLLRILHFENNDIFIVGGIVQSTAGSTDYIVTPQLTVANLLAGQSCIPVYYPLSEFTPESLVASETGVILRDPSENILEKKEAFTKVQQALLDRSTSKNISLVPEGYEEIELDTYSQEELDLEDEMFYTPLLDLLYGL